MAGLDPEVRKRLAQQLGEQFDLEARPRSLDSFLKAAGKAPAFDLAADDHYKGDTFTKEYPGGGTYTKNYIRGYARPDPDDMVRFDELQLQVDQAVVDGLRAFAKEKGRRRPR